MTSRMRSRIGRGIALGALVVLMTGCIKLDMHLEVSADDTVSGTMVFAFSKQLLALTGQSAEQLFQGSSSGIPSDVPGTSTAPYEDDRFVGQTITFDHVELSRFNTEGSDLRIEHVGDEFHVSGTMDLTSDTGSTAGGIGDISQLAGTAEISITITFPGAVTSSATGAIDGNSVTWTPTLGQKTDLTAVASAIPSGGGFPWIWVLVGVGVLVLAFVLILVVINRKGRRGAAGEEGVPPAEEEGTGAGAPTGSDTPTPATTDAQPPPPPPPPPPPATD